jgi:mRNA interferase RelE/StbE
MTVLFSNDFDRDISKLKEKKVAASVLTKVEQIRAATSIAQLSGIKKMHGRENAFRIRIGNYRLGFYLTDNAVLIARIMHRKDIYKYFPR